MKVFNLGQYFLEMFLFLSADYNIEYAHIYRDKNFGVEQKKSIEILHDTIKSLQKLKKSYVLCVLIDEYNPKKQKLDFEKFITALKKSRAEPNFVFFESNLVPYYEFLLEKMTPCLRKEYKKYIEKNNKIPCSLLIAIWYLKRLGIIETKSEELQGLGHKSIKKFVARKIINILPKKYQEVEERGKKIIACTRFKNRLNDISNIFF